MSKAIAGRHFEDAKARRWLGPGVLTVEFKDRLDVGVCFEFFVNSEYRGYLPLEQAADEVWMHSAVLTLAEEARR